MKQSNKVSDKADLQQETQQEIKDACEGFAIDCTVFYISFDKTEKVSTASNAKLKVMLGQKVEQKMTPIKNNKNALDNEEICAWIKKITLEYKSLTDPNACNDVVEDSEIEYYNIGNGLIQIVEKKSNLDKEVVNKIISTPEPEPLAMTK